MKLTFLSLLFIFIGTLYSFGQPTTFITTIGGNQDDKALDCVQSNDGNFILVGYTAENTNSKKNGYVMKIDSFGTVLWTKTIDDSNQDHVFNRVLQLSNGNILVTDKNKNIIGSIGIHLFTNQGELIWSKKLLPSLKGSIESLLETKDGNILFGGIVLKYVFSISVGKINQNGDLIWFNLYNTNLNPSQYILRSNIIESTPNRYTLVGSWALKQMFLEINKNGSLIKANAYKKENTEATFGSAAKFIDIKENSIKLLSTFNYDFDFSGVKLNNIHPETHEVIESKYYKSQSKNLNLNSAFPYENESLVLAGNNLMSYKNSDAFLFKINKNGNVIWAKSYSVKEKNNINKILKLKDGILCIGETQDIESGSMDILIIKTDLEGNVLDCSNDLDIFVENVNEKKEAISLSTTKLEELIDNTYFVKSSSLEKSNKCYPSPIAKFQFENDTICQHECINFFNNSLYDISSSWTFTGTTPTFTNTENPKNICYNTPGKYKITLTAYNSVGSNSISKFITVLPSPTIELGPDTLLCNEEILTLDAQNLNAEHLWNDGTTDPTLVVNSSGTYTVQSSIYQCTAYDTITVSFIDSPVIKASKDTFVCEGNSVLLDITQPNECTYLWDDGSTESTYLVNHFGIYTYEIVNNCGILKDSFFVNKMSPIEELDLEDEVNICEGDTLWIDISRQDATDYQWNTGNTSNTIALTKNGTYYVTVSNSCYTVEDETNIISKLCCDIYMPNTFSPNSDGINDVFQPNKSNHSCQSITSFSLKIFDRFGNQVFHSSDLDTYWDGRIKGEKAIQGVYVYILTYQSQYEKRTKKGTITLLR